MKKSRTRRYGPEERELARDRKKTIESLRRLAERPGTAAEGETARLLMERMGAVPRKVFAMIDFARGTEIFYNYWAYKHNQRGVIVGRKPSVIQGKTWIRIKFDHLKTVRSVPITSVKGCHISTEPRTQEDCEYLYIPYD